MKVNYIFKLTTLDNNDRYKWIVQKVDKMKRTIEPPTNTACTVEFLNQTQIRQKIGNKLDFLYALKMAHYNNAILVYNDFYQNGNICKIVTTGELKSEVEKYDDNATNFEGGRKES